MLNRESVTHSTSIFTHQFKIRTTRNQALSSRFATRAEFVGELKYTVGKQTLHNDLQSREIGVLRRPASAL